MLQRASLHIKLISLVEYISWGGAPKSGITESKGISILCPSLPSPVLSPKEVALFHKIKKKKYNIYIRRYTQAILQYYQGLALMI